MSHTITVYTNVYAPMGEGDGEPEKLSEREDTFTIEDFQDDHGDWNDGCTSWVPASIVATTVSMLNGGSGITNRFWVSSASSSPEWNPGTWYEQATYEHPYTGTREERTAHLAGYTPEEGRAVYDALTMAGALH